MPQSAPLPFVARRNSPSDLQPATESMMWPSSSQKSPRVLSLSPPVSDPEPLGNKLQRLAVLSPEHIASVELLVDHILKSIEGNGRGLFLLACCVLI